MVCRSRFSTVSGHEVGCITTDSDARTSARCRPLISAQTSQCGCGLDVILRGYVEDERLPGRERLGRAPRVIGFSMKAQTHCLGRVDGDPPRFAIVHRAEIDSSATRLDGHSLQRDPRLIDHHDVRGNPGDAPGHDQYPGDAEDDGGEDLAGDHKRIVETFPSHRELMSYEALGRRALCLGQLEKLNDSIPYLLKASALDPTDSD